MRLLRKILVRLVRIFARRYIPPRISITHDRITDIRAKISGSSPVIIDGGGHVGEFSDVMLRQYDNPVIHIFEPIPTLAATLKNKYKDNGAVTVHELALGPEKGPVDLNITNALPATSILKPAEALVKYHGKMVEISDTIDVPQDRLDNLFDEEVDVIKLDLQGYELEALKGSTSLLNRVKLILTEVEFIPLYKDQVLFSDIDAFLRQQGFMLHNLYDLHTHSDGQLSSGDAIYLNKLYFD